VSDSNNEKWASAFRRWVDGKVQNLGDIRAILKQCREDLEEARLEIERVQKVIKLGTKECIEAKRLCIQLAFGAKEPDRGWRKKVERYQKELDEPKE
jgi:hypothetical protein